MYKEKYTFDDLLEIMARLRRKRLSVGQGADP